MPHAYTEEQLVEQPAIGLSAELGWTTVSALEETFGATGTLLRETKGEVVLVSRLRAALKRVNLALTPVAIATASISGKIPASPRAEITVFIETPGLKGRLGLIEWLTAACCKSLIFSRFLFELKTSR
jgi:hypothetical protein